MTIPDNRIRYPAAKIDFTADVGVTGQDHDSYPAPGGQARFDHMRMALIGLLSQQSSFDEPSQRRDGTPWFDLNTFALKIWYNGSWQLYSHAIPLEVDGLDKISLADWYDQVNNSIAGLAPEVCFHGTCTTAGASQISIPSSLLPYIYSDSRVFLYVNGTAIDPSEVQLIGSPIPDTIDLLNHEFDNGDLFHVQIRRVPSTTFYSPSVTIV